MTGFTGQELIMALSSLGAGIAMVAMIGVGIAAVAFVAVILGGISSAKLFHAKTYANIITGQNVKRT